VPHVCHPQKPLAISIKIESGVELAGDFLVLVILEAHHLSHLELITSFLDEIEVVIVMGSHPFPIDPLGLHHGFHLWNIDRLVPISVEETQKVLISTHPRAYVN
jgi:hypothetical protein